VTARITVLGSGSAGNATLIEAGKFGILVDCGFSHRELANRLHAVGRTWTSINAVVITHTHSDHWNKFALAHLRSLGIPLYLHPQHHDAFAATDVYAPLKTAGLLCDYSPGMAFDVGPVRVLAMRVCHDSEPTLAFRFDGDNWAYGHASDLGCVDEHLIDLFHGIDVLGLEFNHDVPMQRKSRRPRFLIERVLSEDGHLSNEQAAEAMLAIIESCGPSGLQAVIQLHLSRECNTAELARRAALDVLDRVSPGTQLITSEQLVPAQSIALGGPAPKLLTTAVASAAPF
jgi:phosphoribosyl 1,2-cyclic phosphodiesterase